MSRVIALTLGLFATCGALAQMPKLDDLVKGASALSKPPAGQATLGAPDDKTGAAGIKEALAVGTQNAVKSLSRADGYFGNQAVKILMPSNLQKVADAARLVGFQKQVDDFVLGMNRAAEAAAPQAAQIFGDAIRSMSLEDARAILTGGDTAATDFFRRNSQDKLYAAFKPVISKKVGESGAARAYADLMGRYERVPMAGRQSLDLDDYVTNKSLEGLYRLVGEEEKKIRANPAARTTDLLKAVFGR